MLFSSFSGVTPLMEASRTGSAGAVRSLLDHEAKRPVLLGRERRRGQQTDEVIVDAVQGLNRRFGHEAQG